MSGITIPQDVERIDRNEDGSLDDVAISLGGGMFRLEQMDKGVWWMALYMPDGRMHTFHFQREGADQGPSRGESP